MALERVKTSILLMLIPTLVCLAASLYISARDGGHDIEAQEINAFGMSYYAVFKNSHFCIFDGEFKKLLEYRTGGETVVISRCISDLDDDEADEILLLTGNSGSEYASDLLILKIRSNGMDTDRESYEAAQSISLDLIYKKDMTDLKPWKVQTCDVDGDGKTEISIGVYKTAIFHPVMAKRPFIYEWHGNAISPKWLGSRLARPFDDYIFSDINNDGIDELISIEHLGDGRKAVNSYTWKGFGFDGTGGSDAFDDILSIKRIMSEDGTEYVEADVVDNGEQKRIILHFSGSRLEQAAL